MIAFPEISALPPLKFRPVYVERPWGGTLLAELLKRKTPDDVRIGEA